MLSASLLPAPLALVLLALAASACQAPAPSPKEEEEEEKPDAARPKDAAASKDVKVAADAKVTPDAEEPADSMTPPADGGGADSMTPPADGGGDGGSGKTLLDDPTGPMPMDLKDTGIFTAFPDVTKVDARAFAFEPKYPLWSNGLGKSRYAVLPAGKQIDSAVRDAWEFPVGTIFVKSFSTKDPANAAAKPTYVETRIIRRVADVGEIYEQWEFHVYEWNAAGTGATLADIKKPIPREVTLGAEKFTHNIPGRKDCWNCHIANKSIIIGFDELRLNYKIGAAAQTQLEQVMAKSWLSKAPVAPIATVTGGRTALETQVMEYVQANCAHCHNGEPPREPGARYAALDLRYMNAVKSMVNVDTMSVGTKAGKRVVPRDPNNSILLQAMKAIGNPMADPEVKPMPTVGVQRMDQAAVTMIENWIKALPL